MANMTFKANLLPQTNLGYELGSSTQKWKINGVTDPKLSDTTYTFANGSNGSFSVTPLGGSAQTVSIGKPATAGTADVANSVAWGNVSGKPSTFPPSSHTHLVTEIMQGNAAVAGSLDPLTQALIGSAASNKSFGLPAEAITIEYSTNGGSTWIDYGATDAQKKALFSETRGFNASLGKATTAAANSVNNQLRITIEPTDRYTSFNGLYIWMSSQGNTVTVDLERSTIGAKDTFTSVFTGQSIAGWSGNNIRYFSYGSFGGGSTQTSNNYKYRLIFKQTAINSNYASANINDIRFLGLNVWSSPNNMVSKNHLYTWNENLDATFPAQITATAFNGNASSSSAVKDNGNGTLTKFQYSASGMSSTSWLGSWDGYTLKAISPANAVKSGVGTTAIGSTTKPVYWTGSAFSAITSYEGTASKAAAANITTSAGRIAYYSDNAGTFASDSDLVYDSSNNEILITHKSGASPEVRVKYGTTVNMAFGIGSGDTNHGIYDTVAGKWMIVADTSGNVVVNGNSETATKLKTARSINGTNFDGSANITTANWGTSRTLTIGSTGKSVNGSGNVSWSLSEIGAAASSHNHATLTIGSKTYNGSSNVTIGIADLGLASTTTFLGITSTDLSNGSTTSPIAIVTGPTTGNVTPTNGSVVMEQTSGEEYIWDGSKWNTMGLASSWALANHVHGNILNNGTITSDTAKASGQHLVITDSNNKVARSNITLGTATTTYLRNDGTWATPANNYVTQNAAITTAGAYPVILAYNTGTAAVTNTVNKASTLTYNPSTTKLHTPIIELTNASYGETLPSTGSEGQIFFQLSEESGSLDSRYVAKAGDTMTGNLLISKDDTSEAICRSVNSNGAVELLASTNRGLYDRTNTKWIVYLQVSDSTARTQYPLYGAVWNDYAEFRETKEKIEPGRCIREIGDDTLELTTERLMRGCEIVSDTFGFAIGQSEKANTPTAASGRVLAYLYEDRETARQHIGWPVCSGPNGTVSIMTEEEEEKYPSRIIGTISAIPDYDVWYGGSNGDAPIQVNGRIWIRIK